VSVTKRLVGQFVVPMQIYSYEVFPNNQEMFEDLLNLKNLVYDSKNYFESSYSLS